MTNSSKPDDAQANEKGCTLSSSSKATSRKADNKLGRPKHYCELCGKTFKRGHNLKIHGRMHSGVTPYVCPYPSCGKKFRWKSSIVSHKKWHKHKCKDVLPEEADELWASKFMAKAFPVPVTNVTEGNPRRLSPLSTSVSDNFFGSPVSSLLEPNDFLNVDGNLQQPSAAGDGEISPPYPGESMLNDPLADHNISLGLSSSLEHLASPLI